MEQPRLMKSDSDKIFSGVCGGIAEYLGVDSVLVRLAFILLIFASGIGVLLYLALMVLMPTAASLGRDSAGVMRENFEQVSNDISSGMKRVRGHPQGPAIAAGLLIMLGAYFLFSNLGLLGWLRGDLIWPLALIGLGIYLFTRKAGS